MRLPEKMIPGKIGNGLGGFIQGFVGRINQLTFDDYYFNGVITNFQEINEEGNKRVNFGRNGILGNEILSRFKVIFDFARSKVYLRPIKKYNKYFKYDKSGITVIASGKKLDTYIVKDLIPNSPAAEAGVLKGDIIIGINHTPAKQKGVKRISSIFQKRTKKRIRLVILRNGEKKIIKFRLRDLI